MVSERSGAAFYTRDVNTFVLHKLDLLRVLETIASPVVVNLLGLPEKTTESFILGFLRRDYGAAGLFAMAERECSRLFSLL